MSDEKYDDEDVARLFQVLLGQVPDKRSTTTALINKAEELYINVSGMQAMNPDNGGKGYSTGGAGEQLALYSGLDWNSIDTKLAGVCQSLWHNLESLMERLQHSSDPDEIQMYVELRQQHDMHLVQNVSYHSFWLGFFTHELGEQDGTVIAVDESAVPVPPLDAEIVATLTNNAVLQAMSDIDTIEQRDDESDEDWHARVDDYRMPSLGVTMDELLGFQHAATSAAMATISNNPASLVGNDGEMNVWGMTVALGIMIGRALERRGDGQSAPSE